MTPAEIATTYLAAFATGDPDAVAACVTDDFVNAHASALGSGCAGKEEYRRRLPGFLASMPSLRYDVERVIAEGPWVSVSYRLHAEPGGTAVDIAGVMVIETRGDLVAQRTDYWDALTFLRQTGQA